MSITLTLTGETLAECYRKLGMTDNKTSVAPTEELVEELRRRLRPQGMVLNIEKAQEPTEEGQFGDDAPEAAAAAPTEVATAEKPKRGRPPKAVAAPAAAAAAAQNGGSPGATREQVIAALNEFATARGGQVAARQAMQDACGVTRLVDVKPEDYGKLLAHLKG